MKIQLSVIALLTLQTLFAQDLFIPPTVQKAYENQTRDKNGRPGAHYWQNSGDYHIQLKINPPDRKVIGWETIKYTNSSPDTLKSLVFKLLLNHHKATVPRLWQVSPDYLTDGITITKFIENGIERTWESKNDGINKEITLTNPLAPNTSIDLTFEWNFELSKQSGREGVIDSTSFFLAYFYPRIAVYDDYEGWDKMITQGNQEFYNDFNNYSFEVTVPKNYIVWATGDLQNPTDVLQKQYAERLQKSFTSDEVVCIANQEDLANHSVTKQSDFNIWKWKSTNISDITIALSNHYNWDAGSVIVDSTSGRRASVQAAYDEPSQDFEQMVNFGKHALNWFSHHYPGIPYPYSKMTVFRGFADMEYPMMANDNSQSDPTLTRFIVEHEIAHTYFPFYMGINETRFAFMDEGWATTFEYLIGISNIGKDKATEFFKEFRSSRWAEITSIEQSVPIITPSNVLGTSRAAFASNAYERAALGYLAVKDLLGDKVFKFALHGYMDRWNGKHPIPWDFFYSFNDLSVQNLNWFWNNWFFENNYIDLAIKKAKIGSASGKLFIQNIGGAYAPFDVIVHNQNGQTQTTHFTAEVWKKRKKTLVIKVNNTKNATKITLDGGIWMDANTKNNEWNKDN